MPDLVAEVVSPSNTASEVQAKVEDRLHAGTRLVWVVYPETRTVTVYQGDGVARVLHQADTLGGGAVLPGFSLPVAEVF